MQFLWNYAARTRIGTDPEKRKRCGTTARQDNTGRQSAIFLRWLGAWQCGQGQLSELAWSSSRDLCSPADFNGHRDESTGQAGCNSSKTGRRYSTTDEEHDWQSYAADSSDDSGDGRSEPWLEDIVVGSTHFAPYKPFGHVSLTNPAPSRDECFKCKKVGLYARDCPKRTNKTGL